MSRSWDVFDTLIGRLCQHGTEVFELVERKIQRPGFARVRRECETCGLNNTYDRMFVWFGHDKALSDCAMQAELDMEYEMSFPIQKFLSQVAPGDMLVSDMYLSADQIRHLVGKHKDTQGVSMFVSVGGKASGQFWKSNPACKHLLYHIGDNMHSDVLMAQANGVPARYIGDYVAFTPVEMQFMRCTSSIELGRILRAVRLSLLVDNDPWTTAFCNAVLPGAVAMALLSAKGVSGGGGVAFSGPHSYWVHKAFRCLFNGSTWDEEHPKDGALLVRVDYPSWSRAFGPPCDAYADLDFTVFRPHCVGMEMFSRYVATYGKYVTIARPENVTHENVVRFCVSCLSSVPALGPGRHNLCGRVARDIVSCEINGTFYTTMPSDPHALYLQEVLNWKSVVDLTPKEPSLDLAILHECMPVHVRMLLGGASARRVLLTTQDQEAEELLRINGYARTSQVDVLYVKQ